MTDDSKARIALVVLNRQYLISLFDSGTIDLLIDSGSCEVSVFSPKPVLDLLPTDTKYKKFKIDSI